MLAELAAFNAGYAIVSKAISNGREIGGVLGSLANMVGAEESLRARGSRKQSSVWSKAFGKSGDDFAEFQSLSAIKEKRTELESICRLYAKPGTWDEFLSYEAKMRVKRKEEAEERERATAQIINYCTWGAAILISLLGFYSLYTFTEFLQSLK